jgi:hypothetical protein
MVQTKSKNKPKGASVRIPPAAAEALRKQAKRNHRTTGQEAVVVLQKGGLFFEEPEITAEMLAK